MKRYPVPMTKDKLVNLLGAITDRVEKGDSFEGGLEYMLPNPPEDHQVLADIHETSVFCKVCGLGCSDAAGGLAELVRLHEGDPDLTEDGDKTEFMVEAGFRVGNSLGQGGFVMAGELR